MRGRRNCWGAESEEWAERLRLLETRVEQSEQREAEQLRLFETGIAQSKQREAALHKRVAFLEGTVQRLRPSSEQAEATAPKVRTGKAAVGPMGEPEAVGRRLNAPTCCRWTADGTCGTVPAERFEVCTHMHEYLETKTTTHEFADLDACLGPDASKWSATFDGASSDVTLSYDAVVMTTLKTPLKVTHAADCSNVTPTLNVQMDTVLAHTLTPYLPNQVSFAGARGPYTGLRGNKDERRWPKLAEPWRPGRARWPRTVGRALGGREIAHIPKFLVPDVCDVCATHESIRDWDCASLARVVHRYEVRTHLIHQNTSSIYRDRRTTAPLTRPSVSHISGHSRHQPRFSHLRCTIISSRNSFKV